MSLVLALRFVQAPVLVLTLILVVSSALVLSLTLTTLIVSSTNPTTQYARTI